MVCTMFSPVLQQTCPGQPQASPVQHKSSNMWTGLYPVCNLSVPAPHLPGWLEVRPHRTNPPEYTGHDIYTVSTKRLIYDCSLVISKLPCSPHTSPHQQKYLRAGRIAAAEMTCGVRAMRDTPVADYLVPSINTWCRVA